VDLAEILMPTLKDVGELLGMQSELAMAAKLGLKAPISTLALIRKYEQLPPKAHFSVAPSSDTMPLAVQFTDRFPGYITKRDWSFDNGEKSDDPGPSHTYRSNGNTWCVTDNTELSGIAA